MAKTKIEELDPCLPNPRQVMTPAELVMWEKRLRAEKEDTQKSGEKD